MLGFSFTAFFALIKLAHGHYTWPQLIYGGVEDSQWQHVRQTDNFESQAPVTNVTDPSVRCYNTQWLATAETLSVTAGETITFVLDNVLYHPGVVNVYMAQAPASANITTWDPTTAVWFKTYQISAIVNSSGWTWLENNWPSVPNIPIPADLPSGNYLLRIEQIALHLSETYGGAQLYIACAQLAVTGGGSGVPGPLVAFPGEYTGYEPGILINIYSEPYPTSYTQPGPPVWTGGVYSGGGTTGTTTTTHTTTTTTSGVKSTTTTTTTTTAKTTTTTTKTATGTTTIGECSALYAQCGGTGWTGPTCCYSGTCQAQNSYYSQCL